MIDRLLSCVVAVCLALLIWIYARSREQEMLDHVAVPVQVTLTPRQQDHYTLKLTGPAQVTISFSGPPQRMRELHGMIQRKELHVAKTITVPDDRLHESRYSDSLVVEAGEVNTPLGVTAIISEGRNRVPFTLYRLVERRLPVRFDSIRDGPTGPLVLEPATVLVRGPRDVLDRTQYIKTQPSELPSVPLRGTPNVASIRVPLVDELEGRPVRVTPSRVVVRAPGQARKLYEISDVAVQFLCPANFHLKPRFIDERNGKITLRLLGPHQDEPPVVYAFIDLTKGKYVSGLTHEPLKLQLPRDFQLAQDPPRVVTFELLPGDFAPELGMPSPVIPPAGPLGQDRGP